MVNTFGHCVIRLFNTDSNIHEETDDSTEKFKYRLLLLLLWQKKVYFFSFFFFVTQWFFRRTQEKHYVLLCWLCSFFLFCIFVPYKQFASIKSQLFYKTVSLWIVVFASPIIIMGKTFMSSVFIMWFDGF